MKYEYHVVKNGVEFSRLETFKSEAPTISLINSAEIKTTFAGTFKIPEKEIDLINDRIRPIAVFPDGTKRQLGEFIITDVARNSSFAKNRITLSCYDLTYLCKNTKTESREYISAGTKYTVAIKAQLVACGISDILIEENPTTISTDREDWEPGTDRLTIINQLLKEINYNSLYMDLGGVLCCNSYKKPSAENVTHRYTADDYSILYPDSSITTDTFDRTNVFIVRVEKASTHHMEAIAVNDSPLSPISTINQKRRVVSYEKINDIASQAELQIYVDNKKFKSLTSRQTVEFQTGFTLHNAFEIIHLSKGTTDGIFEETEWSLSCSNTSPISHKARRVTLI